MLFASPTLEFIRFITVVYCVPTGVAEDISSGANIDGIATNSAKLGVIPLEIELSPLGGLRP